jgi:hypothetical protein
MISPPLIEQLVLAGCIALSSYLYNEKFQEKLYVVQYESGLQDSLYILNRGEHFCPSYCGVDHMHRSHEASYNCNQVSCEHHKFDMLVSRVKIKKSRRKPKGLPMGQEEIISYDMEATK